MAVSLAAGDRAPSFRLPDQDGHLHDPRDYHGQTVVLYFYPKDDTPGCTAEACSFRDRYVDLQREGVVLLGVSTDDAASHQRFRDRHALPFPLLVDHGATVATAYGAWGEKTLYGRKFIGMTRSTFIIGPDGVLRRVWKRATAAGHGDAVLRAIQELKAAGRIDSAG